MKIVANLYIHPDAVVYNGQDSREDVEKKLKTLVSDMKEVQYEHSDENKFHAPYTICEIPFFKETSMFEIAEECLNNDEKGVFYSIIGNTSSELDSLTLEDLKGKCIYSEEEIEVNSIIVLNKPIPAPEKEEEEEAVKEDEQKDSKKKGKEEKEKPEEFKAIIDDYITFENYEIVYDKQSWQHLRRQILGNHPGTPDEFITECRKYFPNLVIHENCKSSLIDEEYKYLDYIPRRIIYYLSCLNDEFTTIQKQYKAGADRNDVIAHFSGNFGLDKAGSIEQNPEKKPLLTFQFAKESDGSLCPVLCEPHLKIEYKDNNCKNAIKSPFHPRIYFCYDRPEIANGKIFVGSIGKHL